MIVQSLKSKILFVLFICSFLGVHSQSNNEIIGKYRQLDTITCLNIVEITLFDNNTYICLGIKGEEGHAVAWYSSGRYIILENLLKLKSYYFLSKDSRAELAQQEFIDKYQSILYSATIPFEMTKFNNYKFVIKDRLLLDESNRTYFPLK